jgi:hypothetical protein
MVWAVEGENSSRPYPTTRQRRARRISQTRQPEASGRRRPGELNDTPEGTVQL